MQKLNSADNPRLFKDKRQTQLITQYKPSKEDIRVLLEVEVIENENLMDESDVIEVTIIPPETADPFVHFPRDSANFRTEKISELEYHAEAYRRPAIGVTDQCRIPPLHDKQRRNSFFAYNLTDDPAINVGEIVGDSLSKVLSKQRIVMPKDNVKLRHGDHCDSFISDPEIAHAKIGLRTVSTDLLKSNVNFCNSESKIRDTPPYVNPQVYQVHLEAKSAHPLVELSAAQIILEAYKPNESSKCDAKHQIIEALRKTLTEWGSDERRIADTLFNDCSSLMKCEHCGVISFKKKQMLTPTTIGDEFSVKVDNARQLRCGDDEGCLRTGNTEGFYDDSRLNAHDQIPRNQSIENIPRSKFSTPSTENEASKDELKVRKPGIKKLPENSSQPKFESPHYTPNTKLFLRAPINADNIDTPSAMDTMTAERDGDFLCGNMIKMIDVGRKKESKINMPSSVTTNRCGRCLLSVEKNEKSNDARFRNSYSTRYSPRQIIAKSFKKPVEKTCRDHRIGKNFQTGNNSTKIQGKYSTLLRKDCKQTKAPICMTSNMENNNLNDTLMTEPKTKTVAKSKTSSVKDSSRKNKLIRPVVPPSNIPTKLERNSRIKPLSSNNAAKCMLREKPYAVARKERPLLQIDVEPVVPRQRSLIPSKNHECELRSKAHSLSRQNKILHAELIQEKNLTKNLPYCCTASSDDQLSEQDQEEAGNNHLSNSDNDRRSVRRSKNYRKFNQIVPHFNYSAPLIGLAKKPFEDNDFVIDRYLATSSPPAQYNAESETTAFSSSSSENATREWADSFAQVPRFQYEPLSVKSNDQSSCVMIQNIRAQIEKAIEKCSNYSVVASKENTCSHETLTDTDNSLKLDQKNASPNLDHITKQYERFRNTNCHHSSDDEAMPSTNAALPIRLRSEDGRRMRGLFKTMDDSEKLLLVDKTTKMTNEFLDSTFDTSRNDRQLKVVVNKCRDNGNHEIYTVEEYRSKKSRPAMNTDENVAEKICGEHSEIRQSQVSFDTSEEIFPSKLKYAATRTPVSKSFANCKSAIDPLKLMYENPAPVISSSSEYSNEYHLELGAQQGSLCKEAGGSVLQLNKSKTFECQITYDQFSSKDISTESKENMEAKALPVYRKILESKDEMDWETFQQLVGTLHPSQKELWCDICKAVSNEAKRVSGETGASTEVCIEINPVSTSQTLPFAEKRTRIKTSGNEISFEMDMILIESETFFKETK